jgi:hypothetical protein
MGIAMREADPLQGARVAVEQAKLGAAAGVFVLHPIFQDGAFGPEATHIEPRR